MIELNLKILTGAYETYIFAAAAIFLLAALIYLVNGAFKKAAHSRFLIIFLKAVRICAFVALALLSFNPSFSYQRTENEKGKFLFVFDTSSSMGFLDGNTGVSRLQSSINALKSARAADKIAEANSVEFASLSDELLPLKDFTSAATAPPSGSTDISGALGLMMQRGDLSAAIIISDGRSTSDIDPDSIARYVKYPVFTLGAGAASNIKDAAITGADYPKNSYLDEACEITVNLRQSGYGGSRAALTLKEEGEVRHQTPVSFTAGRAEERIKIPLKPSKAGLIKYELSLAPFADEITPLNNTFAFYVNVTEHKIRIFCIQNAPDADFAYMLRFFAAAKDIEFKYKFLKTPNEKLLLKPSDIESGFDIIILGDIDFGSLEGAVAQKLESALSSSGPSALFTGGPNFAISASSPCAGRFPVKLDGAFVYEPVKYKLVLNSGPAAAQITRLSPIARINNYMWNDIPELCGINYMKNEKAGGKPYAPAPSTILSARFLSQTASQMSEAPVLITASSPGRKSAAILGGSFWFLKSGQLFSKNSSFYDKFMGNLILWLYSKEDYVAFKVETDRANYYGEDRVFVSISARNRDFSPMINPSFKITLNNAGGSEHIKPQITMADEGYYEFSFRSKTPGENQIIVEAADAGGKKDSAAARFMILNSSREMLDNSADYDCLKKISEKTGGRFYEKDSIASLFADIPKKGGEKTVNITWKPFENKSVLALILSLLCIEWAVRRYSGLE